MILIYVAIPVALLIAAAAVLAFIWAARADQYEDLDTPPLRMLLEDAPMCGGTPDSAAPPTQAASSSEVAKKQCGKCKNKNCKNRATRLAAGRGLPK